MVRPKQEAGNSSSYLRLIDGDEDKVLLEKVNVPGPRLHPVVLPFLDPEEERKAALSSGRWRNCEGGEGGAYGRLVVSGRLRRSLWFSLL